ncbi:MAG: crotonobetainyl-CoA:carnitine CoA-transferase CaiB-like acyl-CoA transferase [Candidatus Azotimanducaceae bacterium]|jgi:crotonobetainyl-CoA:carnitine CoA-transferase CaiB-like acyl-CoA transferase|tara:strand:- start:2233 stop:4680 length:2448 start_codon:yes stop_codon:yes gene_type:complete
MALEGVRVIDLTDERGIYGAKLLADLGADMVRPEPITGDSLRARGPLMQGQATQTSSLWHAFFASNRRFVSLDPATSDGRTQLQNLINHAEIVLLCKGAFAVDEADIAAAKLARPELIVIDVSSFGTSGPWADYLGPDIVAGALGGAASTTGDADTPPLKGFGEMNFMISGAYVAIAALSALAHVRATGQGQSVGISVHECIASCLEQVFMFYWYEKTLNRPEGKVLPRRGAMHWSDAYTVLNGKGGSIMATPAPDFDRQLMWWIEEGVHDDLIDPKYMEPENLRARTLRAMEVMTDWVAEKDVEALFFEAQSRHSPYGWVLPLEKVAENPQLEARQWYVPYQIGAETISAPGAPYQFSATPWQLNAYRGIGSANEELLNDLNWNSEPTAAHKQVKATADKPQADKPLKGLKVLDFTHVLAGPFATRILADMGADVIKINSADRAVGTQDPHHPYYLMWNRSKRALALNMSQDSAKQLAGQLANQADIVIDNFSAGVLDRWGIGYKQISATNEGVIYVQMSGMGDGGPWSKFVTYAPTIHALCGLTHTTSVPGREDIGLGFSYNDHQAGLHGTVAVLAALEARNRTGKGQRVDVSQFEVGVNFLGPSLLDFFANDNAARPCGNDLPYDAQAPHGCYRCLDETRSTGADEATQAKINERWIAIACTDDAQWQSLCALMQNPSWCQQPRFSSATGRQQARDELNNLVGQWTANHEAYALMALCQGAGVPAGVVQDGADLVERDPQLAEVNFLQAMQDVHPTLGPTWFDRLPLHFEKTQCNDYHRVRAIGEDNEQVLKDWLGLDKASVAAHAAQGTLS